MNEWLPFIALAGLIIALAGLIIGLFAWLRQDIRELSNRVGILETGMAEIRERLARLEGLIEGLFQPRPVSPPPAEHHDKAA